MTEKIQGGYILLARKMLESGIMDKPPLWSKLFLWMLMKANKNEGYRGLKCGELYTSIEKMRDAMTHHVGARPERPSIKQIRVIYEGLAKGTTKGTTKGTPDEPMIMVAKGTPGLKITILNYSKYQNPKNYEGHKKDTPKNEDEGHHEKSTKSQWRAFLITKQEEYKNKQEIYKYISPQMLDFIVDFIFHISDTKGNRAPKKTEALFNNSLDTILKLIRLDGFTFEYIAEVIRWVPRDDFWSDNLFSLAVLRTKSKNGITKFQNIANKYEQRLNGKKQTKFNKNAQACMEFIND